MSEIILQISAGTGPDECGRAVVLLAEAVVEAATNLKVMEIDRQMGGPKGCARSVSLHLEGDGAESFSKSFEGSVLWRCKSPFRPHHGRKNWYVDVSCFQAPTQDDTDLGEVREQFCRASGPGGQHVNKTSSAVRLVHVATGLTVTASEERNQHRNRKLAYARLWTALEAQRSCETATAQAQRRLAHHHLQRGNPIRTYVGPKFTPAKN